MGAKIIVAGKLEGAVTRRKNAVSFSLTMRECTGVVRVYKITINELASVSMEEGQIFMVEGTLHPKDTYAVNAKRVRNLTKSRIEWEGK